MNYLKTKEIKLIISIISLFALFNIGKFIKIRITSIDLPKGKIVLYSNVDGDYEIYTMNINSTNLKQLTNNSATFGDSAIDDKPSFSLDGKNIVFTSGRQGQDTEFIHDYKGRKIGTQTSKKGTSDIYIMDSDGKNQIPLTHQDLNFSPFFSPNGEYIIFETRTNTSWQTRIVNTEAHYQKILNAKPGHAKFSPDGKQIFDTFQADLSVMDINGTKRVRLTDLLAHEENNPPEKRKMHLDRFDFSSNNKKIAFVVRIEKGASEGEFYEIVKFYTMNIDGSELEEIYKIDSSNLDELYISDDNEKGRFCDIKQFRYSPDNTSIIYLADLTYKKGIYSLNLKDRTVKELTMKNNIWNNILNFTFSPEGKKIVFVADIYPRNYFMRYMHAVILRNLKAYINYYLFRKQTPYYDNKYICIMDIDGKNYRRIAKLPVGSELGHDFIHWEK